MPARILLLAAALLLTVVVVFLWRTSLVEPGVGPRDSDTLPSQASVASAASGVPEAADTGSVAAGTDRVAVADPAGAGVQIRGRLIDTLGRPVTGQQVALRIATAEDAADPRFRVVGASDRQFVPFAETISAEDGTFAFAAPAGVASRLQPISEAIVFRAGPIALEPVIVDRSLGDIVVQAGCVVAGVVRDSLGRPAEGVEVLCGDDSRRFDEATARTVATDGTGSFRFGGLDSGVWRLRCRSPASAAQDRVVELRPEQQLLNVELALGGAGSIRGRVVDDRGSPVPGANVRATSTRAPGEPVVQTSTGTDGRFELGGLAGVEYSVRASASGYRRGRSETAEVGTADLVLLLQHGIALTGIVVDAANMPVEGSRVRAIPANQPADQDRIAALFDPGVTTDADGGFTIENLAAGDYRVVSNGRHLDAKVGPVHVGQDIPPEPLRIVVDRGGIARVTVVDPQGHGVPGARLHALAPEDTSSRPMMLITGGSQFDPAELEAGRPVLRAVTDGAGRAEIWGLDARDYSLQVEVDDDLVQDRLLPFAIRSGAVDLRVQLVRGGFADVVVTDRAGAPRPGRRVEVEGPLVGGEPGHRSAVTDGTGRARIGPLLPGRFAAAVGKTLDNEAMGSGVVLVQPDGGPIHAQTRVEFAIGAGTAATVRLVEPDLATLRGTVTDAQGAVAGALVQVLRQERDVDSVSSFGLDGSVRSAHTRPDGSFSIADLEPGSYIVRFGRRRQPIHAETEVEMPFGVPEVATALVLETAALHFVVVSSVDRQPILGVRATLRRAGDVPPKATSDIGIQDFAFDASPSAQASSDDRGNVEFAALPPGSYAVELTKPQYATGPPRPVLVSTDAGRIDAGVMVLRPGAHLTGTVVDASGARVSAAIIEYREAAATDFRIANVRDGRFEIDGLEPGDYVVRARRPAESAAGATQAAAAPGPELHVHLDAGESPAISLQVPG